MVATLGDLKAQIADDLARSDLSLQIAAAITAAINHYQSHNFYFSETRSRPFNTVVSQSRYTAADSPHIPNYVDIEQAFLHDGSSEYRLTWAKPSDMEFWLGNGSPSNGRPSRYSYFERSVWLYPIPGGVYTFRPLGLTKCVAPTTDIEAENAWMTEGGELIRCRAKAYLNLHVIRDAEEAQKMVQAERDALSRLRDETTKKAGKGGVEATAF